MAGRLSEDDYQHLSTQKADDWRSISEVNPTLFGVAGAIFAAGVAQRQPEVVALSPVALYLGVWHMVRHARLQLQLITYLATHAPPGSNWERDVAAVRLTFWEQTAGRKKPPWLAELMRPSAWNTWLIITTVVSVVAVALPVLAEYPNSLRSVWIGTPVNVGAAIIVFCQSRQIQPDRERWTRLWKQHNPDQE